MKLSWHRSSEVEDRFEQWIVEQHQRRVLAGETIPTGACPNDSFIRDLIRKSPNISLTDPRVNHAATCPKCMNRILALRQAQRSHRRNILIVAVAAPCVILVLAVIIAGYTTQRKRTDSLVVVSQTLDLWDAGTARGEEPARLQSFSLPAAFVHLTIILPLDSPPGQYLVLISRDRNGKGVVAQGRGTTVTDSDNEKITTDLDLSKAGTGPYFLSTTHEQEQATYYYPLQVR